MEPEDEHVIRKIREDANRIIKFVTKQAREPNHGLVMSQYFNGRTGEWVEKRCCFDDIGDYLIFIVWYGTLVDHKYTVSFAREQVEIWNTYFRTRHGFYIDEYMPEDERRPKSVYMYGHQDGFVGLRMLYELTKDEMFLNSLRKLSDATVEFAISSYGLIKNCFIPDAFGLPFFRRAKTISQTISTIFHRPAVDGIVCEELVALYSLTGDKRYLIVAKDVLESWCELPIFQKVGLFPELPNIERILREGVHSDMESCLPPVTSPNWKCYSTGKNPGKLGIFWWENIDLKKKRVYFPRERIYKHKEIWDYLGESGYRVGVINMPLTYPPKKVKGFMVSGGPDAGEKDYTYPKEIESRLKREFNYRVNARWLNHIKTDEEKAVEELYQLIQSRFDAAQMLIEEYQPDFLHLTVFYINTLQHYFWNNEYVEKGWQIIDKNVGKFLDSDTNIFLMSDHGTNEIEQVFYINSWLEKEGYLKLKRLYTTKLLYSFGITKQNMWRLAQTLRVLQIIKKIIPKSVVTSLPADSGTVEREGKATMVDWDNTVAIASGQGPVYLNVENDKKGELVNELIQKLESLVNSTTGKRVASKVYTKEKIYSGSYLSEAPDIIIDQTPGTHIRGGVGNESIFESTSGWRAENRRYGIFAACGPDVIIREIKEVSILDLAPTILSLFGVPYSGDMDGKILPCIREDTRKYGRERERIKRIIKRKNL